jgi:hypothetical protein
MDEQEKSVAKSKEEINVEEEFKDMEVFRSVSPILADASCLIVTMEKKVMFLL